MADLALYEEFLNLPVNAPSDLRGFALDIGASLTKLIYVVNGPTDGSCANDSDQTFVRLRLMAFSNDRLEAILQLIKQEGIPRDRENTPFVAIGYGHGVQRARGVINSTLGLTIAYTDEFTSFARGFYHLCNNLPLDQLLHAEEGAIPEVPIKEEEKYPLVLNFLGSAIVFLSINKGPDAGPKVSIVDGMQRGGLYFLSMSKMLLGTEDFNEVMTLTQKGDPRNVNIMTGDGTDRREYPLGKIWKEDVRSVKREDLAAAFFETTLDDIRSVASTAVTTAKAKSIFFAGSFVKDNKRFKEVMKTLPEWQVKHGLPPVKVGFPKYEAFIGAIGAFVLGTQKLKDPNTEMTQIEMDKSKIARVMAEAGLSPQEMAVMAQMMSGGRQEEGPPSGGRQEGGPPAAGDGDPDRMM